MIVEITKQIPHDPDVRKWTGVFFKPVVNEQYLVPKNASNHPEHRGRVGTCIEARSTNFGLHWAVLEFKEDRVDKRYDCPKIDTIRTNCLIPIEAG